MIIPSDEGGSGMAATDWFIRDRGQIRGPFSRDQLVQMYRRNQLTRFHDISQDRATWVKASSLLDPPAAPVPVPPPTLPEPVATAEIDDSAFAGDLPPSKPPTRRRNWLAIASVPAVLIAAGLAYATVHFIRHQNTFPLGDSGVIRSLDSEDDIAGAVGLVVYGMEHVTPDGQYGDEPCSYGSCFAITEDGYLLTNRHVVAGFDRMVHASDLDHRKSLYLEAEIGAARKALAKLPAGQLTAEQLGLVDMHRQLEARVNSYAKFVPQIWVFFSKKDGRPEKKSAQVIYISDESGEDMAILKIDRMHTPYFGLSAVTKKLPRGSEVVAIGFPGVTRSPVSPEEEIEQEHRDRSSSRIESFLKNRDFEFVRTDGRVSLDFSENSGRRWIQHSAPINPGNSGGPLVSPTGLVLGINTQYPKGAEGTYHAVDVSQMRPVIDEQVKGVSFGNR